MLSTNKNLPLQHECSGIEQIDHYMLRASRRRDASATRIFCAGLILGALIVAGIFITVNFFQ
jgi:hypothetical protein